LTERKVGLSISERSPVRWRMEYILDRFLGLA
jgi:hypothetical protein